MLECGLRAVVLHNKEVVWNYYAEFTTDCRRINTKATIFVGYPCKFRVRSGSSGLKNIYLDVYDSNENVTSIAFISDGDKALIYSVNREEIWRAKL